MAFTCPKEPISGHTEHNIPVKQGAPLSTACDRAGTKGSIPEVLRLPQVTLVAGAVSKTEPTNGGIRNMKAFFKTRKGCYANPEARSTIGCCD